MNRVDELSMSDHKFLMSVLAAAGDELAESSLPDKFSFMLDALILGIAKYEEEKYNQENKS